MPLVILNSENVTVEDLTIFWDRPFHCEGDVIDVGEWGCTLSIPQEFDYEVREGKFHFLNEDTPSNIVKNMLEYDAERRETRFQVWDNFLRGYSPSGEMISRPYQVTALSSRRVRFEMDFKSTPLQGNRMLIMPASRNIPAIVIQHSRSVSLNNTSIYSAGAMGVIAQVSHDLDLRGLKIIPRSEKYYVSTGVDATHFVNCSGAISFKDCEFSNHIDDAINVHGIYLRIADVRSDGTLRLEHMHFQQQGVDMLRPDDIISIDDQYSLNPKEIGQVASLERIDARFLEVKTYGLQGNKVSVGDVVNNLSLQPDMKVNRIRTGRNRARGILVSTAGDAVIKNSYFHTPGTAIRISGGIDKWYESGPVRRVSMTSNHFDNCKYGVWGNAVVDAVAVDASENKDRSPYHGQLEMRDNTFSTFDGLLADLYRVKAFSFVGNIVEKTDAYPAFRDVEQPILSKDVGTQNLRSNTVRGFDPGYKAALSKV
uniref:Alpha-1,3-galactosidase B n=1 Tax=Aquisalinus luteolus TaxID=1566827 RepID=A0A8J3A3T6_9PROT|nr:alpha-1,3-galactosidase B [Aquisalinus luteolus]